ncbi:hypothetical protein [Methylobacillus sp.]|uniref:hypothetical protein n=1 Tax=Methylobacillus sp. TaxID=56818 RepID=UPI0012C3F79B|nr:hypothetical protein [Methylobacillus sp.]MPS48572.1 hypothetical protein [Methylobacillus sp.]
MQTQTDKTVFVPRTPSPERLAMIAQAVELGGANRAADILSSWDYQAQEEQKINSTNESWG